MGQSQPVELIATLNELLEAERAGTRVALATRKQATNQRVADFMLGIERDEARWCGMLKTQVERLGGIASETCGAFYEKAMAIPDPIERLSFLNRGQGWVVRKLKELTPRVDDAALRDALDDMEKSHVENIAATETLIQSLSAPSV
jgi:hypothetical protein